MKLTDAVAAQVMGEIQVLTRQIEEQQEKSAEVVEMLLEAARLASEGRAHTAVYQRISSDSATSERQKTFVWAAGSLTMLSMFMFGAGMALGAKAGLGAVLLAAMSSGFGLIAGLVLFQVLVAGQQVSTGEVKAQKNQNSSVNDDKWTETKILQAARAIGLEPKITAACQHVLLGTYTTAFQAAVREKVNPIHVKNALMKCEEWKQNN